MNKCIREFVEQCAHTPNPHFWFNYEKFTELVIKECASQITSTDLGDVEGGDSSVLRATADQVKSHFGIK